MTIFPLHLATPVSCFVLHIVELIVLDSDLDPNFQYNKKEADSAGERNAIHDVHLSIVMETNIAYRIGD